MIIERVPCGLCRRLAPEGYRLCGRGSLDLQHALDDIVRIHATLDDPEALLPRTGDGSRGSPGYRSTSPANDLLIALRDRRTVARGPHDPHDLLGVLHSWAEMVREQTGIGVRQVGCSTALRMYRTVIGAVRVLVRMHDWITRQEWADSLTREVMEIRDTLLEATGAALGRVRIGRCITVVDSPDGDGQQRCGYLLQARLGDKAIHCPRCDTPWPRLAWPDLGRAMRAAAVDESTG